MKFESAGFWSNAYSFFNLFSPNIIKCCILLDASFFEVFACRFITSQDVIFLSILLNIITHQFPTVVFPSYCLWDDRFRMKKNRCDVLFSVISAVLSFITEQAVSSILGCTDYSSCRLAVQSGVLFMKNLWGISSVIVMDHHCLHEQVFHKIILSHYQC